MSKLEELGGKNKQFLHNSELSHSINNSEPRKQKVKAMINDYFNYILENKGLFLIECLIMDNSLNEHYNNNKIQKLMTSIPDFE